jgi:hypothetical protein
MYNVTQARLCNHSYSGKAISATHSECLFVVLGIQRAMRMRHVAICGMSGSVVFFYILINDTTSKKLLNTICVSCCWTEHFVFRCEMTSKCSRAL